MTCNNLTGLDKFKTVSIGITTKYCATTGTASGIFNGSPIQNLSQIFNWFDWKCRTCHSTISNPERKWLLYDPYWQGPFRGYWNSWWRSNQPGIRCKHCRPRCRRSWQLSWWTQLQFGMAKWFTRVGRSGPRKIPWHSNKSHWSIDKRSHPGIGWSYQIG